MNRVTRVVAVAVACCVLGAFALAADGSGDAIVGLWLTAPSENGRARVEITRNADGYDGRIVWLEQPDYPPDDPGGMAGKPKVDRENPDPDLRTRPILGLEMVKGFEWSGDESWAGGTIYDPETGNTYKCKARITKDGHLKVRGYIGISLFGRTTVWTRVAQETEPAPAASEPAGRADE